VLEIRDTGRGIAKEQLPGLFQRFEKGATNLDPDSYGLGLSIVRTIADLHGIAIEVNSIAGLGTSFLLTFPAAPGGQ
jgi:signal transduction histidine kinase